MRTTMKFVDGWNVTKQVMDTPEKKEVVVIASKEKEKEEPYVGSLQEKLEVEAITDYQAHWEIENAQTESAFD